MHGPAITAYFAQFEPLAVQIVDDPTPNLDAGMTMSNQEIAERACQLMGWESFDLFDKIDYPVIYNHSDPDVILAYAYLVFLRWRLFTAADAAGVGAPNANAYMAALSEYWYVKLSERQHSLRTGIPLAHHWIH